MSSAQRKAPRRAASLRFLALACYVFFVAGAVVWTLAARRPWYRLFWDPLRASPGLVVAGAACGAALGLAVVLLSRFSAKRTRWGVELYRWFASLLGPVSWFDAWWLATLSGAGEELLFRGAMQPDLGLALTTVLFGALHLPPRLRLASWTLAAGALGLAFGLLTLWTGNLAGAFVGHFTVNLFNLRFVSRFVPAASEGLFPPESR